MLPLAQKQQPEPVELAQQRFWIDPDVEVALTAQINEHFPPEAATLSFAGQAREPSPALMDCYNRDNPDCMPGLPSSYQHGDNAT